MSPALPIAELNDPATFDSSRAYGVSKLMNVMFVRAVAAAEENKAVYVNAAHPGFVQTELTRNIGASMGQWVCVYPCVHVCMCVHMCVCVWLCVCLYVAVCVCLFSWRLVLSGPMLSVDVFSANGVRERECLHACYVCVCVCARRLGAVHR